jgi:deoxyribodipyrimidine photolyase
MRVNPDPSYALIWFRRDLRLQDNPALNAALASGLPVMALYLFDPEPEEGWPMGAASRWYLHQSLLSYYRIFNPERQAKQHDPDGAYVQRWLNGDDSVPIIDLAASRARALMRYQKGIR